jgi:hypothetical protein
LAGTARAVRGDASLTRRTGPDGEPLNDISKLCREQAQSAAWSFAESVALYAATHLESRTGRRQSRACRGRRWRAPVRESKRLVGSLGDHARWQRTRHGARPGHRRTIPAGRVSGRVRRQLS